jgi:hypothetical protein
MTPNGRRFVSSHESTVASSRVRLAPARSASIDAGVAGKLGDPTTVIQKQALS